MLSFFVDPIFRAPFLGSMLMCLASALVGTYLLVRRHTLLGEALSHATYPGVTIGLMLGAFFLSPSDDSLIFFVLAGAFIFSIWGMSVIEKLHVKYRIHLDATMCLVLSLFLGLGVVIASRMQFTHPLWYQQAQVFIYGQAATMTDWHVVIYGVLSLSIVAVMVGCFRQVELIAFDRVYAKTLGVPLRQIHSILVVLIVLAIVVGIRSVGVIMMSGMLIAPGVSARAFTNRFSHVMALAGLFGVISGFGGNYFSFLFSQRGVNLPTGPMILLFSVSLSLLSLLLAPKRGAFARFIRIFRFRRECLSENILKTLWKGGENHPMKEQDILHWHPIFRVNLRWTLFILRRQGWIKKVQSGFLLTPDGIKRAAHLVRLHRLWELYLTSCLDVDKARVHRSAEEMEHIITPELECQLNELLENPKQDPHKKPIPRGHLKC